MLFVFRIIKFHYNTSNENIFIKSILISKKKIFRTNFHLIFTLLKKNYTFIYIVDIVKIYENIKKEILYVSFC